jgi:hypothetical protein
MMTHDGPLFPQVPLIDPQGFTRALTKRNRGFALIVTLSLMMLLAVVAVGLLSLATITLRQAGLVSDQVIARDNARLALMLAIGELQKNAGPDQRVTAAADIAGAAGGLTLAAGANPINNTSITGDTKGLSALRPGTRYWTGVWRNRNLTLPGLPTPGIEIFTKTPSPFRLQWLVSGNEISTTPAFTPASSTCTLQEDGSVADSKTAVVLVGEGTVGSPSALTLGNYVSAPLVDISVTNSSGRKSNGRYAWWVGDEGIKAKINTSRTKTGNTSYASLAPQRRGWETVSGFADYPTPAAPGHNSLPKIVTLAETPLLIASAGAKSGGVSPLQSAFHSATTESRGVLADPLNGGTRIDLTSILAAELPATGKLTSIANYPTQSGNVISRIGAINIKAPKWEALKEFHDRSKSLQSGSLVVKAATTAFAASVAPVITDFRLLMGVKFVPSGSDFKVNACGKIAIAIANPYSTPLKWNSDLEIEVFNQCPPGNSPARVWNLGGNTVYIPGNPSENALFNNAYFRIRPGSLAAGEARAYTVAGPTLRAVNTSNKNSPRVVVDLTPFSSTPSFDFSNCLEMDTNGVYSSFPGMDIRESWQTTQIGLEMRLAGGSSSSQPLRVIERFELDNGYYGPNTRNFSPADAAATSKPVPLMCYGFQVSQPGADYINYMPGDYEMGQRSSTLRTFADFNLQATRIPKVIASYNPPPYFMESNNSIGMLPTDPPGGNTGTAFTRNLLANPMPWGRAPNGSKTTVLFAIPSQLTSLAQFQHADLTGDETAASLGHQPGNAFANSYATPFVKRTLTRQPRTDYVVIGSPNPSGAEQYPRTYYDISYLLNASLWDTYFLSTIPNTSAADSTPENPNLMLYNADEKPSDLKDPVFCATRLMIDGAFNVNCTSVSAWKAFLASSKHFKHKADPAAASPNAAFPRSLEQISTSANPPTGTNTDSFSGFRRLTDTELNALATEIVKQVRLRGPFVSVSHFVNRAIGDIVRQPALTRCGALQAAIDESGLTINLAGNKKAFTNSAFNINADRVTLAEKEGSPRADLDGGDRDGRPPDAETSVPDWALTSTDNNFGAVASIIADRSMLNSQKTEQGYRSTGIPGWLTQADVLQVIGPTLSTRSDTFRIRTYGEALGPDGKVVAKAYCEAIVQRIPDYLDSSNPAAARGTALTPINKTHGRQFTIVSFRWLSPQEI